MKYQILLVVALAFVVGCGGSGQEVADAPAEPAAGPAIKLEVEIPEPMPVPEYVEPESDTDWVARVNNKDKEIVEILNIITPIAAYITVGFDQYGDRFSPTLDEEWVDTQAQLTSALTLYEDCKGRIAEGVADKDLFLDMENVWQILVKTGVAGVRTKSMVDSELTKFAG